MPVLNWMGRLREDLQMEEGNLNRRRKRGPDGEGGGSDPAGSGGRLAMLFRLGVGRAKSKFYDHSLCWRDVLFFKNVSKFHPPPLLNRMKRAPNSLGESWCVLFLTTLPRSIPK